MSGINRIILLGRLTNNPKEGETTGGKKSTSFSLAVNEYFAGRESTEFFNIKAFGSPAEFSNMYLKKGFKTISFLL